MSIKLPHLFLATLPPPVSQSLAKFYPLLDYTTIINLFILIKHLKICPGLYNSVYLFIYVIILISSWIISYSG